MIHELQNLIHASLMPMHDAFLSYAYVGLRKNARNGRDARVAPLIPCGHFSAAPPIGPPGTIKKVVNSRIRAVLTTAGLDGAALPVGAPGVLPRPAAVWPRRFPRGRPGSRGLQAPAPRQRAGRAGDRRGPVSQEPRSRPGRGRPLARKDFRSRKVFLVMAWKILRDWKILRGTGPYRAPPVTTGTPARTAPGRPARHNNRFQSFTLQKTAT